MTSLLPYLVQEEISPSTRAAFSEHTWCLQLLNDSTLIPTLRNQDAILAIQSFYIPPPPPQPFPSPSTPSTASNTTSSLSGELHTLYLLGTGVSGHAGIAHGGLTATLLDQQVGSLAIADPATPNPRTVSCNIRYLRPLRIPGGVLVRAWKTKAEGRKHWVGADVRDGDGNVVARTEGLFLNVEGRL
ncbi:MAG: hypothetical protein M1820_004940 [Bogoriella megaspora]|nr:MAG: hypothetical protein M1820_004940 [Bogoriella megaspora]